MKTKRTYWDHSKPSKDHKGKKYPTLTDMAKAYGLTQACLSRRLNIYKWDIEKALTTPTKNSPKPITDHKGNWYKSLSELAEAYGLDRKTITYRLTSGWTLEDALTKPPRSKK